MTTPAEDARREAEIRLSLAQREQDFGDYDVAALLALLDQERAKSAGLRKALEASMGYLLNAKIDLETGCTKATAIRTIEGGIAMARAALSASPSPTLQTPSD